ncbi:tRNA-specific 2-thiouridylase [Parelusimicrobium proximum]|uniref:tRNA 2-thiouridine(34) synthase MnmA n=1 Tax=Parelusimicrobium proximum TaxID=3228953 RepID=UPI003D1672D6
MKILVGLSGGVDSALAAYLLKEQGHDVSGAIMSIWDPSMPVPKTENNYACMGPEEKDIETASKIADFLRIPFQVVDCVEEYKNIVIKNFKDEYKAGRTPNPCVWCNTYIKFGILPAAAERTGIKFDKFATGHYADIIYNKDINMYQLKRASNTLKDQTYFLYRLSQDQLSKTLFPLGNMTKEQVRAKAKEIGLPVAEKPDSQDFYCGDYNDILQFKAEPGNIVDKTGKVLGKHNGIWNYTIGKRKGLGISGTAEPVYVTAISAAQNIVVVGTKEDLYSDTLIAEQVTWGSIQPPAEPIEAEVKIRQQHPPAKAVIYPKEGGKAEVKFAKGQMSVTAGQSAVFYQGDILLGGGIIS